MAYINVKMYANRLRVKKTKFYEEEDPWIGIQIWIKVGSFS